MKKQLKTSKEEAKKLINDVSDKESEIKKAKKEIEKHRKDSETRQAEVIDLSSK